MKNNKGQMNMVGGLILLAITIIVGAILLQGAAQNTSGVINTVSVVNESMGVASNTTTVYYTNYRALNNVVILNASGAGVAVPATNYTVANNIVYNGALASSITPKATAAYRGYEWNVTYTAEPLTYGDSAGRSLTSLIIIMMALALAAVVIGYVVSKSQLD